ncbi:MAG: hypothetical protein ACPGU1_17920 [Myxococcota bacterium]
MQHRDPHASARTGDLTPIDSASPPRFRPRTPSALAALGLFACIAMSAPQLMVANAQQAPLPEHIDPMQDLLWGTPAFFPHCWDCDIGYAEELKLHFSLNDFVDWHLGLTSMLSEPLDWSNEKEVKEAALNHLLEREGGLAAICEAHMDQPCSLSPCSEQNATCQLIQPVYINPDIALSPRNLLWIYDMPVPIAYALIELTCECGCLYEPPPCPECGKA